MTPKKTPEELALSLSIPEQAPPSSAEKLTPTPREQLAESISDIIGDASEQAGTFERDGQTITLIRRSRISELGLGIFVEAEIIETKLPEGELSNDDPDALIRLSYYDSSDGIKIPDHAGGHSTDGTKTSVQVRTNDGSVEVTKRYTAKEAQKGRKGRVAYVPKVEKLEFADAAEEDGFIQEFSTKIEITKRIGTELKARRRKARLEKEMASAILPHDTL